jgi:hypothetical protein
LCSVLHQIISEKGYVKSALAFLKPDFVNAEASQALALYCSALFTWQSAAKNDSFLAGILNSIRTLGMHSPIGFFTLSFTELAFWCLPNLQPQGATGPDMVQCQACGVRGTFTKVRVFDPQNRKGDLSIFSGPVIQCRGCKTYVVYKVFPVRPSLDNKREWGPWFKFPSSPEWLGCREVAKAVVTTVPVTAPKAAITGTIAPVQPDLDCTIQVRDVGAYAFGKPVAGALAMTPVVLE